MKLDFDQIKRTTDLVRVVECYGITLEKRGQRPCRPLSFHDDHKPSLRVTGGKGLVSLSGLWRDRQRHSVRGPEGRHHRPGSGLEAVPGHPRRHHGQRLEASHRPAARRARAVTRGDGQAVATGGRLLRQDAAQGPGRPRLLEDPQAGRPDHAGSLSGWLQQRHAARRPAQGGGNPRRLEGFGRA